MRITCQARVFGFQRTGLYLRWQAISLERVVMVGLSRQEGLNRATERSLISAQCRGATAHGGDGSPCPLDHQFGSTPAARFLLAEAMTSGTIAERRS